MTPQGIYYLLKSRAKRAGVKDFSPHDFRRTFVGDLLDAGVDIAIVAKMAGHASVNTTARYDRRPERAKQEAARLLEVPYTRTRRYVRCSTLKLQPSRPGRKGPGSPAAGG